MKNREYFLREDLSVYKIKYKLLCNICNLEVLVKKIEDSEHIKRIKIVEENENL